MTDAEVLRGNRSSSHLWPIPGRVARYRRRLLSAASLLLAFLALSVVGAQSANASNFAGSIWEFPFANNGKVVAAPNGSLVEAECRDISPDGAELWNLPEGGVGARVCWNAVVDGAGNSYIYTVNESQEPTFYSLDALGSVRWSTSTGDYVGSALGTEVTPVLGPNGIVYAMGFNGLYTNIFGFNRATGAKVFESGPISFVTGMYAFSGGLAVVDGPGRVLYFNYAGELQHEYEASPALTAYQGLPDRGGANGDVFMAGYEGCSEVAVEKFTSAGRAWSWTKPVVGCTQTTLGATPDGGAILGRDAGDGAMEYVSLGTNGAERWTRRIAGPTGTSGQLYQYSIDPIYVDVNGVAALPASVEYSCSTQIFNAGETCPGAQVDFVSATTGVPAYPSLLALGSSDGGLIPFSIAFGAGRAYISGDRMEAEHDIGRAVMAFSVPGLGEDYQLALQEALTAEPNPTPPPSGGQPPAPISTPSPPATPALQCWHPHGTVVQRLLALSKCEFAQTLLEAKCGAGIASLVFLPLKSLKVAETASGLLDLSKLPAGLRAIGKVYNDLSKATFLKSAPKGFKTPLEAFHRLENLKQAWEAARLLPDLKLALKPKNYSEIALDITKIAGLKSCVQLVADAIS